jgi:hypothetical protein
MIKASFTSLERREGRRLGLHDTTWRIGAMVDQGDLGTSDLARLPRGRLRQPSADSLLWSSCRVHRAQRDTENTMTSPLTGRLIIPVHTWLGSAGLTCVASARIVTRLVSTLDLFDATSMCRIGSADRVWFRKPRDCRSVTATQHQQSTVDTSGDRATRLPL